MKKPTIELTCCDCFKCFIAYSKKQKRCGDCQKHFRNNGRGGYKYTRLCQDCGGVFKDSNGRAKRCHHCNTTGECLVCSTTFKRKSPAKRYCSDKCSAIAKADYYYGGNYSKVLFRDNNQCRKCGAKEKLQVHHIDHSGTENVKAFKSNNDMNNLITLCSYCHPEIHVITDNYLIKKYEEEVKMLLEKFIRGEL